jgi:peptidyl-prolyl cis-trans isomerase B (cyclophilin B)
MKKWWTVICGVCILTMLVSCGELKETVSGSETTQNVSSVAEESSATVWMQEHYPSNGEVELLNFRSLEEGETIAVITTSLGVIKIRFFPEAAPLAVENFTALVEKKYYDHTDSNLVTVHKACENSFIQMGDPTGTGAGGTSASGEPFADEFSEQALNVRGAVGMANNGADTNTSQFYIVQAPKDTITDEMWAVLEERQQKLFPQKVQEIYEENGGMPWLDFQNTVFGQVIEGMDIVDQIAAVEVNEKDVPVTPVVIESIVLTTYQNTSAVSSQTE